MSRRKRRALVALAIVAIVIVAGVTVFRTESRKISVALGSFLTERVGKARNLRFEIGDISGSLVGNVTVTDFRIIYTGAPEQRVLFSAAKIYASYDLASFFRGPARIDSVDVESPRLVVPLRPDGSRVFPSGDSKPGPAGKLFALAVHSIRTTDFSGLVEGKEPILIRSENALVSYAQADDSSTIAIRRLDVTYDKATRIDSLTGTVRDFPDSVEINDLRVVAPQLGLSVTGVFGKGNNKSLRGEVALDSLGVAEVPAFLGRPRGAQEGTVRGRVGIGGRYDDLALDLDLAASFDGWQVDSLRAAVDYGSKTLTIRHLTTMVNGSNFAFEGTLAFKGVPEYNGTVSFKDLDVSRFAVENKPDYDSDLTGSVALDGRGFDLKTLDVTAFPDLSRSRWREWTFDRAGGMIHISPTDLTVDSLDTFVGTTQVRTQGTVSWKGDVGLDFDVNCPDLSDLYGYHKIKDLRGEVVAEADLRVSPSGAFRMSSESLGRGIDYAGAYMESLFVDFDIAKDLHSLTGDAKIRANTLNLRGFKAGELKSNLAIEDSVIAIEGLDITRPSGELLAARGDVTIRKQGYLVAIDSLFMEMAGTAWQNSETIRVESTRDSMDVSSFELASGMGKVSFSNSYYAGGRFGLETSVRDFDLDRLKTAIGKDIPTGTLTLDFDAEGSADRLAFSLDFRVAKGDVRAVSFDTLSGSLGYDGRDLTIHRIGLYYNGSSVLVEGAIPVDLAPERIRALAQAGRTDEIIGDLGDISVRASNMDIAVFSPLAPPIARIRGIVELEATVGGRRDDPRITSRGNLAGMVYGETAVGDLSWNLSLRDSVLHFTSLDITKGVESVSITGDIPAALSILPFKSGFPRNPIDLAIKATNGNADLLCEVIPKFKVCTGTYATDLRIGGTLDDPTFTGSFSLTGAAFRLEGLAEPIEDINVQGEARGRRFDIENLTAEDKTLKAKGFVALEGVKVSDWDFSITMDELAVTEVEDVYAVVTGSLTVTAVPGEGAGIPVIPSIEGKVTIVEGEYNYSLGAAPSTAAEPGVEAEPTWVMNIEVKIPNDFWIRGKDIDAELSGDVNVRKGAEGLTVLGTLTTLRGTFSIYNNTFRISKGEFTFNDVNSIRNAYIDLEATSNVMGEEITIAAKGQMDKLDITATSASGWSQTDIFKALTLRSGVEGAPQGLFANQLLQSWGVALVNQFGSGVARELGLDEFGIEVGGTTQGGTLASTRVTVGKYVTPKVYLKYSQSLERFAGTTSSASQPGTSFPEGQLNIEYRLSDKFSFAGETGMAGGFAYFDVDLKYTFGY
jgi:hypothetical protein